MWELINDVDILNFELECVADNLSAIHSTMEADEGRNWQHLCNAVFSVCLHIQSIQERLDKRVDNAADALKAQRC